jgi:hypothetical protein
MRRGWDWAYGLLFGLSIFGFPVVSAIPVILGMESRAFSIAFRAFVVALSLLIVARGVYRRYPRLSGSGAWVFVALVGMILARMLWDSVMARLPLDLPWQDLWLFAVGVTLLPGTAFLLVPTKSMLDACYRCALVVGTVSVLAILASVAASVEDLSKLGRLSTEVLNPISVGHAGVSVLIVCLARLAGAATSPPVRPAGSLIRLTVGLLGLGMAIASASRGPLVALVVTLGVAVAFRGESKEWRTQLVSRVLGAAITVAVPVLGIIAADAFTPFQILARLADFLSDPSTMVRTRIMTDALSQFNDSPVFGSATVEYNERFYPHNILVESLMVGGVACFAALAVFLSIAATASVRIYRRSPERRWLVLLFVQYLIDSMFSGSLYSSPTFWVTSLMVINAARNPLELTRLGTKFPSGSAEAT